MQFTFQNPKQVQKMPLHS